MSIVYITIPRPRFRLVVSLPGLSNANFFENKAPVKRENFIQQNSFFVRVRAGFVCDKGKTVFYGDVAAIVRESLQFHDEIYHFSLCSVFKYWLDNLGGNRRESGQW